MTSLEERCRIIRSIGQECIQEDELWDLLSRKPEPVFFDAFVPSGRIHLAEEIMRVVNVKKLTSAGCRVKLLVRDRLAQMSYKMGHHKENIMAVGRYFIEIWKALGMDLEGGEIEVFWSSELIKQRASDYFKLMMDVAERNDLSRIRRGFQTMGHNENTELCGVQVVHACMQCADVFFLEADVCLCMDRSQTNISFREYYDDIKKDIQQGNNPIISSSVSFDRKPIFLLCHMLPGLKECQDNITRSDHSSSIFIEDDEAEVKSKIKKAYCPLGKVEGNPCLEYLKYLVFPSFEEEGFEVERKAQHGGNKMYRSYEVLEADYKNDLLHPGDLKPALSKALNKILQPVRDHFTTNGNARELLKCIKNLNLLEGSAHAGVTKKGRVMGPKRCGGNPKLVHREETSLAFEKRNGEADGHLFPNGTLQPHPHNSLYASVQHSSAPCPNSQMSLEKRYQIIRSIGEECIQEDELWNLLYCKPEPICYDGFEPSGRMHIAQGVMKAINVNKLASAGCRIKLLVADMFAHMNNKMGRDIEKIKVVGCYFIEIWKALGMDIEGGKVEFLWSSELINQRASDYFELMMDIAERNNLSRILRCCQIMGRNENAEMCCAQVIYPCMQCADVFFLEADICQLGMDQRKVNVFAREYYDLIKRDIQQGSKPVVSSFISFDRKPIILSHHMLPGLKEGQEKMSKSDPSSSIFMEDEETEVESKIKKAYCPSGKVEGNPCLEYLKYLVFPWFEEEGLEVERRAVHGGNKTYKSYEELEADYKAGQLDPDDLKPALSKALNKILQPVRDHFATDHNAKELLKLVKEYRVTK